MPLPQTNITAFETMDPPSRDDSVDFDPRAEHAWDCLKGGAPQFNVLAGQVNAMADAANTSATIAIAQAAAAMAMVNVQKWASGVFSDGDVRWAPANGLPYRKRGNGAGVIDPSLDTGNWTPLTALAIQTGTVTSGYTALLSDKGRNLSFSAAGTLLFSAAATLGNGWWCIVQNNCFPAGIVTLDPNGTETLQGYSTYQLKKDWSALVLCDGSGLRILPFVPRSFGQVGTSMAQQAVLDIEGREGDLVHITQSGDITGLTLAPGTRRTLIFDGVCRLINSSTLVTGTGHDITTSAGTVIEVVGDNLGITRVLSCTRIGTLLHVQDQKASGTSGGALSTNAEVARTLNIAVTNTISGASLSGNQITLPAGTYDVEATAPAYAVGGHRLRLYNVTDAATAVVGKSANAPYTASLGVQNEAGLTGRFTIAAAKVFELRHYSKLNSGFGDSAGQAAGATGYGVEVYADLRVRKVS